MKERGCEFLTIPPSYYDMLDGRLEAVGCKVAEDLKVVRELNILCDFDEKGYLL